MTALLCLSKRVSISVVETPSTWARKPIILVRWPGSALISGRMTTRSMVSVYAGPLAEQPLASTTCTVIGKLPVCVGVPERTPAADSVMPAGSVPLLMVNVFAPIAAGAVKLWLKGTFTVPVLVGGFVTVMGWQAMVRV